MRTRFRRSARAHSRRPAPFIILALTLGMLLGGQPAYADLSINDFFLAAGDNPQSLAAADCDGNGTADLIAANFDADQVTVYLNQGLAVFAPAVVIATPPSPSGATCGDVTGDGLYDVVVSSFTDDTITIYAGQEAGGFVVAGTFGVGQGPRSVSLADFDDSGSTDVVVINSRSDNLSVLYGDGAGGFPFGATTFNVDGLNQANSPFSGFVSNYDADPLPDLAIVSQGRPALQVLLNSGAGLSDVPMPDLPRSRGIAGADLNDDGFHDLAVLSTESVVRILLGTAGGSFVLDELVLVHPSARGVGLGDFDQDGLVDLAVAYNQNNTIQVIKATGKGRFPTIAALAAESHNPLGVLAGRATAGSEQLLLADEDARTVSILEADAAGAIVPKFLQSTVNAPRSLILAEMTGDAFLDAVTVVKVGRDVTFEILPGTSDDKFTAALAGPDVCGDGTARGAELCDDGNTKPRDGCSRSCNPEIGRGVASMSAADINGDGHTDLVVVDLRKKLLLLLGDGASRFTEVIKLGKVRSKTTAQVGDFDGNGTIDIGFLPSSPRDGAVVVLFNDGTGTFEEVAVVPSGRFNGPVLSGDVDGNGTLDMVVATARRPRGVVTLLNDGAGPERISEVRKIEKRVSSLVAADFNEDGRLDLLAEFKSRRQLPLLLPGIGAGEFSTGEFASTERFSGATVFDVDHDLHKDIVICDGQPPPPCRALYGDGEGFFGTKSASPNDMIGTNLVHFADADIDLDGVIDTVGVSRNDNRVVVLFRTANSTAVTRVELGVSIKPIVVAVSDTNGDGIPDILVANEGTHDVSRYRQNQALPASPLRGARSFSHVRIETGGVGPLDMTLADLDGTGPTDVVVSLEKLDPANQSGPSGVVLFRVLSGVFQEIGSLPTGRQPVAVAAGLLNDDARVDLVTADYDDHTLTLLLSTGASAYQPAVTLDSGGLRPTDIVIGDVNDDDDLDLVTVNEQSANIAVFLGDGLGNFSVPVSTAPLGRERPWDLCLGDFDGDDDVDLALASLRTADISILSGRGDGTWRDDGRVFTFPHDPQGLVCRDVDGDGLTDVRFPRRDTGRVDTILTGSP